MEYYSVLKIEILSFATTWMDFEYNAKWKRKTNTVWYHLYVESEKYNKLVNVTEKKIDSDWEHTSGYH